MGELSPEPDDLTQEERSVLPPDDLLHRLLGDRRVRGALIFGVPVVIGLFIAVGILASQVGVPHVVTVDGPAAFAPGESTSVRVSYLESDEWGIAKTAPIRRIRIDLCRDDRIDFDANCPRIGEAGGGGRGSGVEVHVEVPDILPGVYPLRIEVSAFERDVRYAIRVRVDPDAARADPQSRLNGRAGPVLLGDSGVQVDLAPARGAVVREAASPIVLRARRRDGSPYVGPIYLLGVGELQSGGYPARIDTDDSGLALLECRVLSFDLRLIVSTEPIPEIDPLELEVGLVSPDSFPAGALIEASFAPVVSGMRFPVRDRPGGDDPFLVSGEPIVVAFGRDAPGSEVQIEVWSQGRLVRMDTLVQSTQPQELVGFVPPRGLVFVQAHGAGKTHEDLVGRHVLVGDGAGPTPEALRELIDAVDWSSGESRWARGLRERAGALDAGAAARAAAYLFGRLDAVFYEHRRLFDSLPEETARAEAVRAGIQGAMSWGIALVGGLFFVAVVIVVTATIQYHRRASRYGGTRVVRTGAEPGQPHVAVYDEVSWWEQWAVYIKGAVGLAVVVATLIAIAILVYGMRSIYLLP